MGISERIALIREKSGITQKKFGKLVDISAQSVSKLEKGENNPSSQTVTLICQKFNVNRTWLETGEGEMYQQPPSQEMIDLAEFARERGATDLELRILRAYFSLPKETRQAVMDFLSGTFERDGKPKPSGE